MNADGGGGAETPLAARARALLGAPPWRDRPQALTLLAAPPPEGTAPGALPRLWLVLAAADARGLGGEWEAALLRHRLRRARADGFALTAVTAEGAAALLDAASPRALEARWEFRRALPLHDPPGRAGGLAGAARRLPEGAFERLARTLFLQACRALDALRAEPPPATEAPEATPLAAGEAAGALARLACLLDEGAHPTADWLRAAARGTALGRRIAPWLDAPAPAGAGAVLEEAARALRRDFAGREWLRDPEGHAFRPPPRR